MKAFRIILALSLLVFVFASFAQPAKAQLFSYTTGTSVMNVGSATANATIVLYDSNGGMINSTPVTIAPLAIYAFYPTASGSVVISSDQPLAAVTDINNVPTTTGAAYVGASAGSNNVALPVLMKANGGTPYYTWVTVQNAGSTDATVTMTYSDIGALPAVTIHPAASKTFYQSGEAHTAKLFAGSISSTQPVVAVVVQENTVPKMLSYSGFPSGSTFPILPLINENNTDPINGITTSSGIMNLGTATTVVTLSYTHVIGTDCTETWTIAAGQTRPFTTYAFLPGQTEPFPGDPTSSSNCVRGQRFIGSARVTANSASQPLAVVVNQQRTSATSKYAEAYGGFDPANASGTVVLPVIEDNWGGGHYTTGFSVMNAGSAATNISCSFSGNVAVTYKAQQPNVQPNAALQDIQGGKLTGHFLGAATCKAYSDAGYLNYDPNAKLVAVVNQTGNPSNGKFYVYEGVNVP